MGKSGSFFFFSHDGRFLIKTMTTDDFNAFFKFFPTYYKYIRNVERSLIARIYGVYKIQLESLDPVYLILMGNTKQIDSEYVRKIYDLKGSLVKREAPCPKCDLSIGCRGKGQVSKSSEEVARLQKKYEQFTIFTAQEKTDKVEEELKKNTHGFEEYFKNTACLKDVNLLNLLKQEVVMKMWKDDPKRLASVMAGDVVLLDNFGLMDYSLLLTVAFNPKYVAAHPDAFCKKKGVTGNDLDEFVKPYKLKYPDLLADREVKLQAREQELQAKEDIEEDSKRKRNNTRVFSNHYSLIEEEFLTYMSGHTRQELVTENERRASLGDQTTARVQLVYNFERFAEEEGSVLSPQSDEAFKIGLREFLSSDNYDAQPGERPELTDEQTEQMANMTEEQKEKFKDKVWLELLPEGFFKQSLFDEHEEAQNEESRTRLKLQDYYQRKHSDRHMYMSDDGMYLYYLGIIDYLQDWNWSKWGENKLKSTISDGELISAVPPSKYSLRYINFMQANVLTNQLSGKNTLAPKNPEDFKTMLARMIRRGKLKPEKV